MPTLIVKMRHINRSNVADPDPGSDAFLTLDLGSAINIPDHIPRAY
jgi:hypothetical protein